MSSIENAVLKNLANVLEHLLSEDIEKPFPRADCRKAVDRAGLRSSDVIPDLNIYFSELAGYCSWDGRITKWSPEKIVTVRERISKSFFQKHPEYHLLEAHISETETPDLARDLELHEKMRSILIAILDHLQSSGVPKT